MSNSRITKDNYYSNLLVINGQRLPVKRLSQENIRPRGSIFFNSEDNSIYISNGVEWVKVLQDDGSVSAAFAEAMEP